MMRSPRAFGFLFAIWMAAALQARSADRVIVSANRWPSVAEVVQRAIANDDLRHQHRLDMECDQILSVQHLNAAGKVFKRKHLRLIHREGAYFSFYVQDGFSPVDEAHHDKDIDKANYNMSVMNLRRLAPRFDCSLADEEAVQGRACYVVVFSSRAGQKAATAEGKVIDQLHGRFWIDEKTYEILQGEGSLGAPVSVGLFTSVQAMSFAFHTQELPGGEVAPADFNVDFTVKAPFYFFRQRQTSRLENWRPATSQP